MCLHERLETGCEQSHPVVECASREGIRSLVGERQAPEALLLVNGRREAGAALAAPVVDDLAAAGRRHAGAEAVGADATNVVGLVRALHGGLFTGSSRERLTLAG